MSWGIQSKIKSNTPDNRIQLVVGAIVTLLIMRHNLPQDERTRLCLQRTESQPKNGAHPSYLLLVFPAGMLLWWRHTHMVGRWWRQCSRVTHTASPAENGKRCYVYNCIVYIGIRRVPKHGLYLIRVCMNTVIQFVQAIVEFFFS